MTAPAVPQNLGFSRRQWKYLSEFLTGLQPTLHITAVAPLEVIHEPDGVHLRLDASEGLDSPLLMDDPIQMQEVFIDVGDVPDGEMWIGWTPTEGAPTIDFYGKDTAGNPYHTVLTVGVTPDSVITGNGTPKQVPVFTDGGKIEDSPIRINPDDSVFIDDTLIITAGTTDDPPLHIYPGDPPSTPVDGDIWMEDDGLHVYAGGQDLALTAATETGGTLRYYRSADLLVSASTTLSKIFPVADNLVAGGKYLFRAWLNLASADAVGGVKFDVNTDTTLTATAIIWSVHLVSDSAGLPNLIVSQGNNALGAAVSYSGIAGGGIVHVEGSIDVNAAGFLNIWFAQASAFGNSTISKGSWLEISRIS